MIFCLHCNRELLAGRRDKKYCSRKCKVEAKNLRLYGKRLNVYRRRRIRGLDRLGGICAVCGFVPVHVGQLDIDHIDGNHKNNNPYNLQVLCANCHRLKTIMNEDWK